MRKLLVALAAVLLLVLIGAAASLYFFRDQLLLSEARKFAAGLPGMQVEIGALETSVLGPFSLTLRDLSVRQSGTLTKIRELRISSPLSLPSLYSAYKAGTELPLQGKVVQPVVELPAEAAEPEAKKPAAEKSMPWPASLALPALSPVPLHAEVSVMDGELRGPYAAKKLEAQLDLRARAEAYEARAGVKLLATLPGAEAALPVSVELKVAGTRKTLKVLSFELGAAGLSLAATGDAALEPVGGKFKLSMEANDLSRLALRPEDRAALGLTEQPSGRFSMKAEATASAKGELGLSGTLSLARVLLPLRLPQKTLFAKTLEGSRVEGPVSLNMELPFRANSVWPLASSPMKMEGGLSASADLTGVLVEKKGLLKKPAGIPLTAELRGSLGESGAKVEAFSFRFHSLQASGAGTAAQPLGKSADITFRVSTPSLAGFPELLPVLAGAAAGGASLEQAQGSISAEGRLKFLTATPAQSFLELKALSLKGVKLPLDYKGEAASASGLLLASFSGAGKYDAGALDIGQSTGSADLTGLSLSVPGKLEKKKGRKLLLHFEAKGNPAKLTVRKASLESDGLNASLSGTVVSSNKGRIQLDLALSAAAELAALREYLPPLPAKISGGSFRAQGKVGGAWLTEGGVSSSPLLLSGSLTGKLENVSMPEPPKEAATAKTKAPPPAALLPDWPAARKAKFGFDITVANFNRGKLSASGIGAKGSLNEGAFVADITVAKAFGGKATLRQVTGTLTTPKLPVRGSATAEGMDLSAMAGFVDPTYASIVKGLLKANASFHVPDAFSEKLLEEAAASGKAEIKNGFVSTASIDGLVNAKLSGIPGVGDKAKISSGGLASEMRTDFSYAQAVATLKNFLAVTPKKDEVSLNGTMTLAFDCDMAGEARLVSAPVQGSVRAANSDAQGRLVVPIRFRGNLKSPSVDIASETIQAMLTKTASYEANKFKDKAISEGKKKLEDEAKKAGADLLQGLFKKK